MEYEGEKKPQVFISCSTDAVDGAFFNKKQALLGVSQILDVGLEAIAFIGDGNNDLPALQLTELGLAGCPNNAQHRVKEVVETHKNGVISHLSYLDAFQYFYDLSKERDLRLLVSDRDGLILTDLGDFDVDNFIRVIDKVGRNGCPELRVLTGASVDQNRSIFCTEKLKRSVQRNEAISANPYIILAENGAIELNVLTGEFRFSRMFSELSGKVTANLGKVEKLFKSELEKSVTPYLLTLSKYSVGQIGAKVEVVRKQTMLTVDVPTGVMDGKIFKHTPEADRFRNMVKLAMQLAVERANLDPIIV